MTEALPETIEQWATAVLDVEESMRASSGVPFVAAILLSRGDWWLAAFRHLPPPAPPGLVLLVPSCSISDEMRAELRRRQPDRLEITVSPEINLADASSHFLRVDGKFAGRLNDAQSAWLKRQLAAGGAGIIAGARVVPAEQAEEARCPKSS